MNWLINIVLNNLLGKATALASSDRVRASLVHILLAGLNAIGLPMIIMKVNALCATLGIPTPCVTMDYAQHAAELISGGILLKGVALIHSIGQRDTMTPAQQYDEKVKGLTQEQIRAQVEKGALPPVRPTDPVK